MSFGKLKDSTENEALPTTAVELVAAVLAKLEASWLGSQFDW